MVHAYMAHLVQNGKGAPVGYFNPAIEIFVKRQPTLSAPGVRLQKDSALALESQREMIERLESLKQALKKRRKEQRYDIGYYSLCNP